MSRPTFRHIVGTGGGRTLCNKTITKQMVTTLHPAIYDPKVLCPECVAIRSNNMQIKTAPQPVEPATTNVRFTRAQLKALRWLPDDGSWITHPNRAMASALDSLGLYHQGVMESERGKFGVKGGECRRVRLTQDGIRMKAEMAETAPTA